MSNINGQLLAIFYFICTLGIQGAYCQNVSDNVFYIKQFGAVGDGKTNDTEAFQKASKALQEKGGRLIITSGKYKVGRQQLMGRLGTGYSYKNESILYFRNTVHPIDIVGQNNAILIAADGLKYGSFNPITGEKDSLRSKGNHSDYEAGAYTFIDAMNCESIKVSGLEIDGNLGHLDIGYPYPADAHGIQLVAVGMWLMANKFVQITDCNIHHCGLDALLIGWPNLKDDDPAYTHILKNVTGNYCGRQGLSWVGGNSLKVIGCDFSHTGKGINAGKPYAVIPGAGVDIEVEGNSVIKNGVFENTTIADNTAPGLYTIGHPLKNILFKKVKFIGTTNSAVYPKSECIKFEDCLFVGRVERIFGSEEKKKAAVFTNCIFSFDTKDSPTGQVFGNQSEFYDIKNVLFKKCVFKLINKPFPASSAQEATYENCTFYQDPGAPAAKFSAILKNNNNRFFIGNTAFRGFDIKGVYILNGKRTSN